MTISSLLSSLHSVKDGLKTALQAKHIDLTGKAFVDYPDIVSDMQLDEVPVGGTVSGRLGPQPNFIPADGSVVLRSAYPELTTAIDNSDVVTLTEGGFRPVSIPGYINNIGTSLVDPKRITFTPNYIILVPNWQEGEINAKHRLLVYDKATLQRVDHGITSWPGISQDWISFRGCHYDDISGDLFLGVSGRTYRVRPDTWSISASNTTYGGSFVVPWGSNLYIGEAYSNQIIVLDKTTLNYVATHTISPTAGQAFSTNAVTVDYDNGFVYICGTTYDDSFNKIAGAPLLYKYTCSTETFSVVTQASGLRASGGAGAELGRMGFANGYLFCYGDFVNSVNAYVVVYDTLNSSSVVTLPTAAEPALNDWGSLVYPYNIIGIGDYILMSGFDLKETSNHLLLDKDFNPKIPIDMPNIWTNKVAADEDYIVHYTLSGYPHVRVAAKTADPNTTTHITIPAIIDYDNIDIAGDSFTYKQIKYQGDAAPRYPVGTVIYDQLNPNHCLKCDGSLITSAGHPSLHALLSSKYNHYTSSTSKGSVVLSSYSGMHVADPAANRLYSRAVNKNNVYIINTSTWSLQADISGLTRANDIAFDDMYLYVIDSLTVRVYDKQGAFIRNIDTSLGWDSVNLTWATRIDVDENYIYVSNSVGPFVIRIDKTNDSIDNTTLAGPLRSLYEAQGNHWGVHDGSIHVHPLLDQMVLGGSSLFKKSTGEIIGNSSIPYSLASAPAKIAHKNNKYYIYQESYFGDPNGLLYITSDLATITDATIPLQSFQNKERPATGYRDACEDRDHWYIATTRVPNYSNFQATVFKVNKVTKQISALIDTNPVGDNNHDMINIAPDGTIYTGEVFLNPVSPGDPIPLPNLGSRTNIPVLIQSSEFQL